MSWCRVKFTLDSQIREVPITYFRDWEKIEKELKQAIIREEYEVFWSSKPGETPEDILNTVGRILSIEDVACTMVCEVPTTGYYKAVVLNFAGSRDELFSLLNNKASRRSLKPNKRIADDKPGTKLKEKRLKVASVKAAKEYTKDFFKGKKKEETEVRMTSNVEPTTGEKELISDPLMESSSLKSVDCESGGTQSNSFPINLNKPRMAKNYAPPKETSSESDFSDGDGNEDDVPLVQYKDKVEQVTRLKLDLKTKIDKNNEYWKASVQKINAEWVSKWDDGIKIWEEKWEEAQTTITSLKKQLEEKQKKMETVEKELNECRSLNLWWQQQEVKRKNAPKSSSSRHHSSDKSSKHSSPQTTTPSSSPKTPSSIVKINNISTPPNVKNLSSTQNLSSPKTPSSSGVVNHPSVLNIRNASPLVKPKIENDTLKETPFQDRIFDLGPDPWDDAPEPEDESLRINDQDNTVKEKDKHDLKVMSGDDKQKEKSTDSSGEAKTANQEVNEEIKKTKQMLVVDETESIVFGVEVDGVLPLTGAQFNSCRTQGFGVKKRGEAGDSLFCKNVLGILEDPQTLCNVSAAGGASTVNKQPARPEISQNIKNYLAILLEKKIQIEERNCPEAEIKRRTKESTINMYVREKIKALRRKSTT